MKKLFIVYFVSFMYFLSGCHKSSIEQNGQDVSASREITSLDMNEFVAQVISYIISADEKMFLDRYMPTRDMIVEFRFGASAREMSKQEQDKFVTSKEGKDMLHFMEAKLTSSFRLAVKKISEAGFIHKKATVHLDKIKMNKSAQTSVSDIIVSVEHGNKVVKMALLGCIQTGDQWRFEEVSEVVETKFKLYYKDKLVDAANYNEFICSPDGIDGCTDSIRFDTESNCFILATIKRSSYACDKANATIMKGDQNMFIIGINIIDSLAFSPGVFLSLDHSKRNAILEIVSMNSYGSDYTNHKNISHAIDAIQEKDFLKYKNYYDSKIDPDSSRIEWADTTFIIKTGNSKLTFRSGGSDFSLPIEHYLGYSKPLNAYIVKFVDGMNEVAGMELIDETLEKRYDFPESPFLTELELPLISPSNNFLLTFSNDYDDQRKGAISIAKINWKHERFAFQYFYNFIIDKIKVEEIVWINDFSFAIKAKRRDTKDRKDIDSYLRVRITE